MTSKRKWAAVPLLFFCMSMLAAPWANAAEKTYDGTFDQAKGIADYGTIWSYECADFEKSPMEWKPMQSEGYKNYSVLPGDMAIYKSYHDTYPSKILAAGYIYAVLEDIAITFTSPEAGTLTIDESVVRHWPYYDDPAQDAGDGILIYILHNDKQIWPKDGKQLVDKNLSPISTFTVPEIQDIQVKKGDKIRFCVNRGANNEWCDDTMWNPVVRLKTQSAATDPTESVTDSPTTEATTEVTTSAPTETTTEISTQAANSTEADSSASQSKEGGVPVGLIVGIVAGVVILAGGGAAAYWFVRKKKSE